MTNSAHDLLLLATGLSQVKNPARLTALFIDGLNALFPGLGFRWVDDAAPGQPNRLEVCTRGRRFGFVVYTAETGFDEATLALIHNASQMLGVILENLHQEQQLLEQKRALETLAEERARIAEELGLRVAQRTVDLEQAAQLLHDSRLAALNMMEDALEARRRVEAFAASLQREIAERQRVEEALRQSEERWQFALEGSGDGVWDWNTQTNKVHYSQQWKSMLGYKEHEIGDALEEWNQRVHPDDRQGVLDEIARHLRGQSLVYSSEHRLRCKDGTYKWILDRGRVTSRAEDGQPLRMIGTHSDISARKQAELLVREQREQLLKQNKQLQAVNAELFANTGALLEVEDELRKLNTRLEQHVEERTLELAQANEELVHANAALQRAARLKDDFLANMSHELRTPLTGILGLSEALQMEIYGPLSDKQRQSLQAIYTSGRHLQELITDILDLSKLEAGKTELQLGPVDVEAVCQASLLFIKQQAFKKDLRISNSFDRQVSLVIADERRLKQMLVNLLSNAVKFTPTGGKVGLEVNGDPGKREAYFVVWDTGIGIPPASQGRLFQPFTQLDTRLAREYEGTGLGLALVKNLAELHGGRVMVESEGLPGRGSRFTLALPWQPEGLLAGDLDDGGRAAAPEAALAPEATTSQGSPLILLAEDNELSRMAIADYLQSRGYRIASAGSGQEVLELARSLLPALILMDIQMPGMDGLEALRCLRADPDPALAATPVVALTAMAMRGDRERCLEAGANVYLAKPVRLAELGQLVLLAIHGGND